MAIVCGKMVKHTAKTLKYCDLLRDRSVSLVVAVGPAGTGKTMIACKTALETVQDGLYDRLVITRPAVYAEENHGYLPGTIEEKMYPWLTPIFDYVPPVQVETCSLAFMRGRTFDNTIVVADEMQNSSVHQMRTLLTRAGDNCKMVVTGDLDQCDLGRGSVNGLGHLIDLLGNDSLEIVSFDDTDTKRSDFVRKINELYKQDQEPITYTRKKVLDMSSTL